MPPGSVPDMKTKITTDSTVIAVPDQVSCQLERESVILHLKTQTYYGLNEAGSTIWKALETPTSVSSLVALLVREFDVTPEACEGDVLQLLSEMASAGLIKVLNAQLA